MRERTAAAVGVALLAGTCGAVQPKINAELGSRVDSALVASLVNFSVALVVVLVALSLRPATRRTLGGLRSWPVPRWTFLSGFGGAVIVLAGAATVDTIGVAVFSVSFFAGQITFGLIVDRTGVGPGGQRPITAPRLQAMVLAVVAVVLSQLGRPVGELEPGLVAFAVGAGAAFAIQSAFNGRITVATGDPVAATAVNVTVGTTVLATVVGTLIALGRIGPLPWPDEPWLYTGGTMGATVVFSLAFATGPLGVLRATLAMLAAQMTAALIVDWTVLGDTPTAGVVVGALLIIAAAGLVGRRPVAPPVGVAGSVGA